MTNSGREQTPQLPEEAVDASYHRMLGGYLLEEKERQQQQISEKDRIIAELRQKSEHWYNMANTDELTGLPNRRLFLQNLEEYAERNPGTFAVAFVDLNGLKRVNDEQGHDKGNEMITTAGATMDENTRHQASDEHESRGHDTLSKVTARLSGDEFGIILPGVTMQEEVDAWTARIERELETRGISAAIGARVHRPDETGLETLAAVDMLMYEKKQAGRLVRQEEEKNTLLPEVRTGMDGFTDWLSSQGLTPTDYIRMYGGGER
jgi:diguanylate cyclase (GGDEF)-like protein